MLGDFALADSALAQLPPVYQSSGVAAGVAVDSGVAGSSVGTAVGTAQVSGEGSTTPVPFDWLQTVISQYANSPIMLTILANFAENVDPTSNLDQFYTMMRDLDTATGYGLDVWGRIVGLPTGRTLSVQVNDYFGLEGPVSYSGNSIGAAPLYAGGQLTENFMLTDDAFRTLILAKAMSNISNGSVKSINAILMYLFGASGNAYCTDGHNMTMTYTFSFTLDPVQSSIVFQTNILPKPVGVALSIVQP